MSADPAGTVNTAVDGGCFTDDGIAKPRYRLPTPMTDPEQLDADIERFLAENRRAASTLAKHPYRFKIFTDWCEDTGQSSELPCPPELVCEYIAALVDGEVLPSRTPPSPNYFSRLLAAIRHVHTDNGFATPTMDPIVRAVRAGAKKRLAALHTPRQAPPLLPDDAVRIAEIEVRSTLADIRRRAVALVAWDTPASVAQLLRIPRTVLREGEGSIRLQLPAMNGRPRRAPAVDVTLQCGQGPDCAYACTVCALRELDAALPASTDPLLAFAVSTDGRSARPLDFADIQTRCRAARGLTQTLQQVFGRSGAPITLGLGSRPIIHTDDPVELQRGRTRLGQAADPAAVLLVRDRAALLLAWHDALRNVEVRTMQRWQLTRTEAGFTVRPGVRKAQQDGDSDPLSITPARDPRLCPVRALDDWLDVYDAVAATVGGGDNGYVFCTAPNGRLQVDSPMSYMNHLTRLKQLSTSAGLDKALSGHSPRRGFAQTAADAGASDEQIRTTMALKTPELVATYRSGATVPAAAPLRRLLAGDGAPGAR